MTATNCVLVRRGPSEPRSAGFPSLLEQLTRLLLSQMPTCYQCSNTALYEYEDGESHHHTDQKWWCAQHRLMREPPEGWPTKAPVVTPWGWRRGVMSPVAWLHTMLAIQSVLAEGMVRDWSVVSRGPEKRPVLEGLVLRLLDELPRCEVEKCRERAFWLHHRFDFFNDISYGVCQKHRAFLLNCHGEEFTKGRLRLPQPEPKEFDFDVLPWSQTVQRLEAVLLPPVAMIRPAVTTTHAWTAPAYVQRAPLVAWP